MSEVTWPTATYPGKNTVKTKKEKDARLVNSITNSLYRGFGLNWDKTIIISVRTKSNHFYTNLVNGDDPKEGLILMF
jgi:hypothetical protein